MRIKRGVFSEQESPKAEKTFDFSLKGCLRSLSPIQKAPGSSKFRNKTEIKREEAENQKEGSSFGKIEGKTGRISSQENSPASYQTHNLRPPRVPLLKKPQNKSSVQTSKSSQDIEKPRIIEEHRHQFGSNQNFSEFPDQTKTQIDFDEKQAENHSELERIRKQNVSIDLAIETDQQDRTNDKTGLLHDSTSQTTLRNLKIASSIGDLLTAETKKDDQESAFRFDHQSICSKMRDQLMDFILTDGELAPSDSQPPQRNGENVEGASQKGKKIFEGEAIQEADEKEEEPKERDFFNFKS